MTPLTRFNSFHPFKFCCFFPFPNSVCTLNFSLNSSLSNPFSPNLSSNYPISSLFSPISYPFSAISYPFPPISYFFSPISYPFSPISSPFSSISSHFSPISSPFPQFQIFLPNSKISLQFPTTLSNSDISPLFPLFCPLLPPLLPISPNSTRGNAAAIGLSILPMPVVTVSQLLASLLS